MRSTVVTKSVALKGLAQRRQMTIARIGDVHEQHRSNSKTDSANYSPQVALQWAESISDTGLKYDSIKHVFAEWNQTDPPAAQTCVATISSLDDQQRQSLLRTLQMPGINASN
jgi:hypothetical protein